MTPAQEAKEFAASHGFIIESNNDRRYNVYKVHTPTHMEQIANVGGYLAALNAMKRHLDVGRVEARVAERQEVQRQIDEHCGAYEIGIPADTIVGETPAFVAVRPVAISTRAHLDELGNSPLYRADFPFDDPASVARVRKAAAERRSGWFVRGQVQPPGCFFDIWHASRSDAVRSIRSAVNFARRNGLPRPNYSIIFKRAA